ncbi:MULTISPECIES: initiation control protein YabA [unclassified Granulicatella]|uniref:initiation control protein YabA n=1 Tax=unclassified Granulicatella TaxID=2630493 RepID=UPI0010731C89|nr:MULTISPECIES: initiation control protein YabA [unclassified Granulicatella]MBF0779972.1 DUF972 family protein [Granulicatella sp. 19428wC4_WM01]TFU95988.1 DUF972 family protein [Granulicatella sp. WM01]
MDSQELYEQLEVVEKSSALIGVTIQNMKDTIHKLIDENSSLKIENAHLREKLDALELVDKELDTKHAQKYGLSNLEHLYDSGVHICHNFYGIQRDEVCLLCESLLSQGED